MKLRASHCAFALPHRHYNLYKHSFVLRCIFDEAQLIAWTNSLLLLYWLFYVCLCVCHQCYIFCFDGILLQTGLSVVFSVAYNIT